MGAQQSHAASHNPGPIGRAAFHALPLAASRASPRPHTDAGGALATSLCRAGARGAAHVHRGDGGCGVRRPRKDRSGQHQHPPPPPLVLFCVVSGGATADRASLHTRAGPRLGVSCADAKTTPQALLWRRTSWPRASPSSCTTLTARPPRGWCACARAIGIDSSYARCWLGV